MEHPWMDRERTFLCAVCLLVWAAILVALSTVSFATKLLAYILVTALVCFHVKHRQLSYEATFVVFALSGLLVATDPVYLPQTVFLAVALFALSILCLMMPIETLFLIIVLSLAITYSVFFLFMVALRTDPAFTGLLLLVLAVFWMVFLRPRGTNDLYT
jgi:hypothetical protein